MLNAQEITGNIFGTITDASGAAIPNATVVVTNTSLNQNVRTLTTNENGNFSATLLPVGKYTVSVEAKGFKKATQTGIEVNVNDRLTLNLTLEVGDISQEVSVQANPDQVELQTASQANLINGSQVRELALNNRNFVQLVTLAPGVSSGTTDQVYVGISNPSGQSNTVSYSINGLRNSQNNWTIDGADNVDRGSNISLLNYPSVDALTEFKVQRSAYSAEFGRAAGGQVNVITKSGTNQFHGTAYEFFRNDKLAANNWLNNRGRVNLSPDGTAQVPPLRYNDFGYNVGGPVYIPGIYNKDKNKTFFFFSQEFRRVITYGSTTGFAPTAAEKQGQFNVPVCVAFTGTGTCSQTATQITNINPVAAAYIKDIWSQVPNGNASNQVFTSLRNVFNQRQELYKIDHIFGEKLSVSGRYLTDNIPTIEPGGLFTGNPLPNVATTNTNAPGHSWVFRATSTLTPTLVNEAGYAYSYGAIVSTISGLISSSASPDVNVNLPYASSLSRIPALTFSGGTSINGFGPYNDFNRNHFAFDNMTKVLGRHTLKFGFAYNHYQKTENAGGNNAGTFAFNNLGAPAGTPTYKQSWANFLLGNVSNFTQDSLDLTPDIRAQQVEFYLQDDFRITPHFTLNLGARYSIFRQPWDNNGYLTNFDPSLYDPSKAPQINPATGLIVPNTGDPLNGIIVADKNSPFGSKVSNENNNNIAPRVGFAWDPFGDGKTSIRSGYGIFYDTILYGVYEQNIFANPPYVSSVAIPNTRLENPAASVPNVSLSPKVLHGTPSDYRTPYSQQWSFDIQRQVLRGAILDVAYVGTKGTHLIGIADINQVPVGAAAASGLVPAGGYITSATTPRLNALRPYLGYNAINSIETWFNSNYHSLQVSLEKRFAGSSQFGLAYTFSKAITDNRSDRSSAPQDVYTFRASERGLAQFDRRHILTVNYIYDLPFFRNQQGFTGKALGGWEISGITTINSGLPLNVTSSLGNDPAGLGFLGASSAGPRPDWVCNPNIGAPHTFQQWFNTSCFAEVPVGQIRPGNAGRSIINGPGLQRWDISLFKNWKLPLGEAGRLQFRAEGFNVFNHPNPDGVSTALGSSNYGQVTSFRDPRIIQLALKLYF